MPTLLRSRVCHLGQPHRSQDDTLPTDQKKQMQTRLEMRTAAAAGDIAKVDGWLRAVSLDDTSIKSPRFGLPEDRLSPRHFSLEHQLRHASNKENASARADRPPRQTMTSRAFEELRAILHRVKSMGPTQVVGQGPVLVTKLEKWRCVCQSMRGRPICMLTNEARTL